MVKPLDTLLAMKAISLAPGLTASDRRVGTVLIEHFNRRNNRCDPGIERMARLLSLCPRTIIRSTQRLEKAGLFRKVRHGGLSNRNSYVPNWSRFNEIENNWRNQLRRDAQARRAGMSHANGQESHLPRDFAVTQTCSDNQLKQTCITGPTEKAGGKDDSVPGRRVTTSGRSGGYIVAERRWSEDLLNNFKHLPVTYGEIIEAIDERVRCSATEAELKERGGGLRYLLKHLKIGGV